MKSMLIVLSLLACLLLAVQAAHAAAPAAYTLNWWTVDGGGGTSQGGTYALSGTVGQAEPGSLYGDVYSLAGGFWATLQAVLEKMFLPLVLRH
jgi:hypothetical protein